MKRFLQRRLQKLAFLGVLAGFGAGALPGCDPDVSNAVLFGLGQTAVAALGAMFDRNEGNVDNGDTGDTSLPTVMNQAFDGTVLPA